MTEVHRIYARLTAPMDDVKTALENDVSLPDGVADIEVNTVNGKLQLQAVPEDTSVGKYTPSAAIKVGIEEKRVVIEDDGEVTHQSVSKYEQGSGWKGMAGEEESHDTRVVEYAEFYGREDEVIIHNLLREEMFDVLCQLTEVCVTGHLNAIVIADGELQPVWYDAGGNEVDCTLEIERSESVGDEYTKTDDSELSWAP